MTGVAVTFYTCIRTALGSNLGRDTNYLEFFPASLGSSRQIPGLYLDQAMAASFQISSSSSVILRFDLCCIEIDSTVKYITKKKGRWKGKGRKYGKIKKKAYRSKNTKVQRKTQRKREKGLNKR